MNKTILFSGILLLFFLFGCINTNENGNGLNETDENETEIPEVNETEEPIIISIGPCNGTEQIDVDICLMENELCDKIVSDELSDQCYFNKLECNYITDEEKKQECSEILIERKCQGSDFPSFCKANLTGNVEYCGLNEDCLINFAYEFKDDTLCEKIETPHVKSGCYAAVNNAWNMCYQLEKFEATQSECLKILSKINRRGTTICDGLTESRYLYDCLSTLAFNTNNEQLCSKILIYNTRRDCYYNIALEYDRPTVCDLNPEKTDADYCRTRLANKLLKPVICEPINDPKFKWGCFGDSIVKGKTLISECKLINAKLYPEWKTLCENVAVDE